MFRVISLFNAIGSECKHLWAILAFAVFQLYQQLCVSAKAFFGSTTFKRTATFACMLLFCAISTYAQSKGAGGFTKATTEISSYQTPVSNLMKAIAAVIVLVGAFNVYFKMQNGDQDVKKTIMFLLMKVNFKQRKIFKIV